MGTKVRVTTAMALLVGSKVSSRHPSLGGGCKANPTVGIECSGSILLQEYSRLIERGLDSSGWHSLDRRWLNDTGMYGSRSNSLVNS